MVHVREVRTEYDTVSADRLDGGRQHRLVRLHGNPALAAEVVRRRQVHPTSDLAPHVRIHAIEAPEPGRHPTAARLEEAEAQPRVPLEDAAFEQVEEAHHRLERVGAGDLREVALEPRGAGGLDPGVRAFVQQHRDLVRLAGREERIERRVAERLPLHRIRPQHDGAEPVPETRLQVLDHPRRIVPRQERRALEPRRALPAEVHDPAVVGPGVGAQSSRVNLVVVDEKRGDARQEDGHVNPRVVHRREVPPGRLRGHQLTSSADGVQGDLDVADLRHPPADLPASHRHHQGNRPQRELPEPGQSLLQPLSGRRQGADVRSEATVLGRQVPRPHLHGLHDVPIGVDDPEAVLHSRFPLGSSPPIAGNPTVTT